jgi:hypothetical protein
MLEKQPWYLLARNLATPLNTLLEPQLGHACPHGLYVLWVILVPGHGQS